MVVMVTKKKAISLFLIAATAFRIFSGREDVAGAPGTQKEAEIAEETKLSGPGGGLQETSMGSSASSRGNSYLRYREAHPNAAWGGQEIIITAEQAKKLQEAEWIESPEGEEGQSVYLYEGGSVAFTAEVAQEGLYQIDLRYYTVAGKNADMEFGLFIDGEIPFFEAEYLSCRRMWRDSCEPGSRKDANGNDLTITQEEVFIWQEAKLRDVGGVYAEPYEFYLSKGSHEIKLISAKEAMVVRSLRLSAPKEVPSYAARKAEWERENIQDYSGDLIIWEAEKSLYKSNSILYGRNDRSSPGTTPYSPSKIRINTIGGSSWSSAGQWIEWEIEVPEDGLYTLAFRARQNVLSGSFATRELWINGELPFAEAKQIEVQYDMGWQRVVIPYKFLLHAGKNVLRLTVTPGSLSDIISSVEQSLYELNDAYRNIVMITGAEPDKYRDYMLEKYTPDSFRIFREQAAVLRQADQDLLKLTGKRGSMNAILQSFAAMLEEFIDKPEKVQKRTGAFKDNIIALGTWLLDIKSNPLEIDKIYLAADGAQVPKANGSFWAGIWHEIQVFAYSFVEDYSMIGGKEGGENAITVWVQAGRDQANIIKEMILNSFTPETGIPVNLKLVQGQLLAATVSGRGPDVALQVGIGEPVNYAMRNAAMPLDGFEGFEEVAGRFRESAFTPFLYNGACYGLPETQTFPVMFYRTDILDELGLEVPETWEEAFVVIGKLQKNNMNVGIPSPYGGLSSLAMLLYQNGGEFYLDGGRRSGLSSVAALEAFEILTSLYSDYSLPVQYDALTRFRTGEMPIVIDDYSLYNYLSVMAPEIKGLWSFAPVPGTKKEDGSVDHSIACGGGASMMLRGAGNPEEAWKFLEWWTRAETQVEYGQSLENHLGASARYATANVEAFSYLSWPRKDFERLNSQWENTRGIPEVAGGYFTARHISNAFQRVYRHGDEAKEALLDYVRVIDEEIAYKRKEVRLDD